jgi:hypothetical protein
MAQENNPSSSIQLVAFNQFVNPSKEKIALNLIYELEKIHSMPDTAGLSKALKLRELKSSISQFVKDHPPRVAN